MTEQRNRWLIIGGWLSIAAAFLHIACIFGGGDWYRFFGAGEELARADEAGLWTPAILTAGIATLLLIWSAYAFAGAGVTRRLPLLRTALVIIASIYLLRGLMIIPILMQPSARTSFNIWSSLIVLIYGITYSVGTLQMWRTISPRRA